MGGNEPNGSQYVPTQFIGGLSWDLDGEWLQQIQESENGMTTVTPVEFTDPFWCPFW